jgi:F-type H+-transporting ATPase subunit a
LTVRPPIPHTSGPVFVPTANTATTMADHNPIYHLKDCYFFEVPKALWRYDWTTLDQVPQFLRDGNPEITDPAAFKEAMDGKILIPQPFAELQSLYAVKSGFGISKYMILELVVAAVMVLLFTRLAGKLRSGGPPTGRLTNMLEAMVLFVRDQIARPAIDGHDHHDEGHGHDAGHGHAAARALPVHEGDRFVPLLLTLFFFILGCNLLGMVPWAGSPTASFSVTLALAGVTLLTVVVAGMRKFGVLGFFTNQVPAMDLPLPLAIVLKPIIFVIEMAGLLIKHGILAVRLLANMVAGHLVLLGIMGLISAAATYSMGLWATVTGISVVSCTLFSVLELFVAFLQAYIFTFLSALFIGASVHQH